jgi:hypothetical protein
LEANRGNFEVAIAVAEARSSRGLTVDDLADVTHHRWPRRFFFLVFETSPTTAHLPMHLRAWLTAERPCFQ